MSHEPDPPSPLLRALALLAALATTPLLALALLLAATAVVPHSRLAALAALTTWTALALLVTPRRRLHVLAAVPALGTVALVAAAAVGSPSGTPPPGSPFSATAPGPARLSPTNLVAEVDQLRLGTYLMAAVDPHIDRPQARRLRDLTTAVYADLHATSPGLVAAGSQLGACYSDLVGPRQPTDHVFRYDPPGTSAEPRPVILFLHGSLGNFQAYIHLLKPVADQLGATLVAPTFGSGNWFQLDALQHLEHTVAYCRSQPDLDPSRITLAGLSNGGVALCRSINARPDPFHAYVFLSPVMPLDFLTGAPDGTRVLVVHGTADRRIPLAAVEAATARLGELGADVTTHLHDGEDHFLLFSQPTTVTTQITTWLGGL